MHRLVPETDPTTIARFRIDGTTAVDALLRDLVRRRTVVTMFGGERALCGVLVSFDDTGLDFAVTSELPSDLPQQDLVAVALVDDVKIQLSCSPIALTAVPKPALRTRRPHAVHRMQRRDGYRVRPLAGDPGLCYLRSPGGRLGPVEVLDVSVVGVALAFPIDHRPPPVGTTLEHCQLHLIPHQLIPCDLVIQRSERGPTTLRVGCRVEPLSIAAEQCLQRTIMEIELRRSS